MSSMIDHESSMSMMTKQRKVEQINRSSSPRERLKADYMSKDPPRLLQRSESVRMLNRYNPSPPLCRRNSSRNAYQHHNYQSNDSPKKVNEHIHFGYNQVTHNPMLHVEKGLPPRPPPRFRSYQPNSRPKYPSTQRRTFQPTNRGIHPIEYNSPSSASSRDHERPSLQRKDSGLHQRPTLQRKDSGHHGHHERLALQRKDAMYRHANPPRHINNGTANSDNPQGGDRLAQPRQFRRSNSLPMSSLENLDSPSSRPQFNRANSMMYRNAPIDSNSNIVKNKFSPRRSTSIYRQFDKEKEITDQDDDIWIERIIKNGISGHKTYFMSVYGNVKRKEPPTGASAIIYLEDIIDERRVESPKPKSVQQLQEGEQQKIEVLPSMKSSSSGRNHDNDDVSSETNKYKKDNKKQKKPIRLANFFGFMTKKRYYKTKSDVK